MSRTTAIWTFPAKSFQANTAKLGTAFGRARPNIIGWFETFQTYIKSFQNLIIPEYIEGGDHDFDTSKIVIVKPSLEKLLKEHCSRQNYSIA